jgi:hypothetical protein
VTLPGHLIGALHGKHPLGPLASNHPLVLSVQMPLRNTAALKVLLAAQDNSHSSLFHHYLTPDLFTAQYGPLPQTMNQVVAFLAGQGLHIDKITANHAFITARGPAAAVERAFAVTIDTYAFDGRTVYAPVNEPSIPSTLAGRSKLSWDWIMLVSITTDRCQHLHEPRRARRMIPVAAIRSAMGRLRSGMRIISTIWWKVRFFMGRGRPSILSSSMAQSKPI